jgi:acylglycerol lipase
MAKAEAKASYQTGYFSSSVDGLKIFYETWTPSKPKKLLIIQHGFGEHSGRYSYLVDRLVNEGIQIWAINSRGHGKSEGVRGDVDDFQLYCDDLTDFIAIARKETGKDKVILLGHSLGGVISTRFVLEDGNQGMIESLILSAPAFSPILDLENQVKKAVGQFLVNFLPSLVIDANLNTKYISTDHQEVKRYKKDPLVHGKISLRMATAFFEEGEKLFDKAGELEIPTLFLHGTGDKIADHQKTMEFYEKVQGTEKLFRLYNGLYHELINEAPDERRLVLDDISQWIAG